MLGQAEKTASLSGRTSRDASFGGGNNSVAASFLGQKRWIRRRAPFPHFIAYDVFAPPVYRRLETTFLELLNETLDQPYMERHDIYGRTVHADLASRFEPLLTHSFHSVLSGVLGIETTGHVAVGMHHHRAGGHHGFPHNDLNVGWFLGQPAPGELGYTSPHIDYTTGSLLQPDAKGIPIETIRAASLLFYLANPPWEPGDGGATGLYKSGSDDIESPVAMAPPINNSLLLFECTPTSYHGFIRNRRTNRNSIVMWLHRPKQAVVDRWGENAIVPYGIIPSRKDAK